MSELTLNYIFPDEEADVVSTAVNPDMHNFDVWVDSMVRTNPDTIFFYTIPTTDIWEDDSVLKCSRSDCPRSFLCSGVCSEASQA